jgi:predicted methyltransferase
VTGAAPPNAATAHAAASDAAAPPPLLTAPVHAALLAAREAGDATVTASFDLGRTQATVRLGRDAWDWHTMPLPYPETCRERTILAWTGRAFEPVQRYTRSLVKLVPTDWGPPTFEIDGIKMLVTARISPFADAAEKVALVAPRGRELLDTCGGLGYFAACALRAGAARVHSFERNADVLWLRSLNPWSPDSPWPKDYDRAAFTLEHADVAARIAALPAHSYDAVLHDPPRFSIAGELYSNAFYAELARVLRPGGRLFHYTGLPQGFSHGRDLRRQVAKRLQDVGFAAEPHGDGVLATLRGRRR